MCHIVPFHNAVAYSMARWTCRSFPNIFTVFATALQKLTAENAARSAAQCAPYSSSSQRFAWSSERRSGQGIPLFLPSMLRSSFDYGRKRGTECKFSARVKGVALAAVQRQSAGRAKRETIPLFFTPARVRAGWWKRTISF